MKSLYKNLILFLLFGCFYVTIEVFYRGFSYPLMFAVGGLSSLLIDKINHTISWDIPFPWQMFIGTCIILIFEFSSGCFALTVLGIRMWDYSLLPFNILGLICPQFALIWFLLSAVVILLADAINYYWLHDSIRPYYRFRRNGKKFFLPERKWK